jgi:hypothetical protein
MISSHSMLRKSPAVAETWLTDARVAQLKATNRKGEGVPPRNVMSLRTSGPCELSSTQKRTTSREVLLAFADDVVTLFCQRTAISEGQLPLLKKQNSNNVL